MTEEGITKEDCPICFEHMNPSNRINCLQCMTCRQKMHHTCLWSFINRDLGRRRLLRDDMLICPVCRSNDIAFCFDTTTDLNEDIKNELKKNPNTTGEAINPSIDNQGRTRMHTIRKRRSKSNSKSRKGRSNSRTKSKRQRVSMKIR